MNDPLLKHGLYLCFDFALLVVGVLIRSDIHWCSLGKQVNGVISIASRRQGVRVLEESRELVEELINSWVNVVRGFVLRFLGKHRDVETKVLLMSAESPKLRGREHATMGLRITLELDEPAIIKELHAKVSVISQDRAQGS